MFKSLMAIAAITIPVLVLQPDVKCAGFLPDNDMNIPVGAGFETFAGFQEQGISEQEFRAVIARAYKLYKDEVAAKGGKLIINALWDDGTVNARATQFFGNWNVDMFGGLARSRTMTVEGFTLVLCHEIGHHLGGAPKGGWLMSWGTVEGGADYYSTSKCVRRMFDEDDNTALLEGRHVDQFGAEHCDAQYTSEKDRAICYRSLIAAESAVGVFHDVKGEDFVAQFNTPDTNVVTSTDDDHPASQCRLDTYYQAALCTVDKNATLSDKDYHVGTCTAPKYNMGLRPRCWFKPDNKDLARARTR